MQQCNIRHQIACTFFKKFLGLTAPGTITNDDHEKSEIFNTYYSSVWTDDNGILPDFPRRVSNDTNIADIVFTSSNVLKQLNNLKVNSSAGPDGIKPIFK